MNREDRAEIVRELPVYQSHKQVRAAKILRVLETGSLDARILVVEGERRIPVGLTWVSKHANLGEGGVVDNLIGGYFVVYDDGYMSWSPAQAFEEGYDPVWKEYRRTNKGLMTPWTEGFDMSLVSVSAEDTANGSPKVGDMIAMNPDNPADKWLVAKDYFEKNFEKIT